MVPVMPATTPVLNPPSATETEPDHDGQPHLATAKALVGRRLPELLRRALRRLGRACQPTAHPQALLPVHPPGARPDPARRTGALRRLPRSAGTGLRRFRQVHTGPGEGLQGLPGCRRPPACVPAEPQGLAAGHTRQGGPAPERLNPIATGAFTMHIVVCIKQVPDSAQIRVHPVTNTIMRQGVPAIVNPYDLFSLEEALRLKDKFGGKVTVICMGPPQAEEALRKCISFGADDAALVTDRAFAGADTLATSYALAAGVRQIAREQAVDIVFTGKQTIDGDTAQVGPGIAKRMGL